MSHTYIADQNEIRDLLYRYAYYVDTDNFAAMDGIFTDDARFVLDGMKSGAWNFSIPEYCEFVHSIVEKCNWVMHNNVNVLVEVKGDEASVSSYLDTTYGVREGESVEAFVLDGTIPTDVHLGARYYDVVVRTEAGWRIKERRCETLFQQNFVR